MSACACLCAQVRNWMFTLFYVAAEMWGDVVLSLLFWGLANEMTSIRCGLPASAPCPNLFAIET
jgi:AAA family ATP:ADP antiporter